LILIRLMLLICKMGLDHEFTPLVLSLFQMLNFSPTRIENFFFKLSLGVVIFLFLHLFDLVVFNLFLFHLLKVEMMFYLTFPLENGSNFPLS
jgi:hypothetical protein